MVLSRLVGGDRDPVPLQPGVELEAGEAEQGGISNCLPSLQLRADHAESNGG